MKVAWIALALAASTAVLANVGCGDDSTGTGGSGGSASSSTTASGTGGESSSSTSASTGGSSSSTGGSSSSTGGGMGYSVCSDCTSNTTGAYTKECAQQVTDCNADPACGTLLTYAYDNCGYDGCCPLKQAAMDGLSGATIALYKAVETCVTCTTCKALCAPDSDAFCAVIQSANPMCP